MTLIVRLTLHVHQVTEDCFTSADDDGDGLANCLDVDCNGSPGYDSFNNLGFCQFGAETSCSDSMDNDGDGDIDCQDLNCANDSACQSSVSEDCLNGVDDDGDGDVDCDDSDCANAQSCQSSGFVRTALMVLMTMGTD